MHKKSLKKGVGLYEIDSINNQNVITIAVNPKEYFEKYKDTNFNKNIKAWKNAFGMNFEFYPGRGLSLNDHENIVRKKNLSKKYRRGSGLKMA